jgi:hypothetical protein
MLAAVLEAATYSFWLLLAILMAITVVGTCRYSRSYGPFFDALQGARPVEAVEKISGVYLRILNRFLGPGVGLQQRGVVEEQKLLGRYVEHLMLFYWFGATVLVLTFRPVETPGPSDSSILQALAFLALLSVNIFTDSWSILWTKRCVACLAVRSAPISVSEVLKILAQDLVVAAALMVAAQIVSNGLYAVQIGRPTEFFHYMFDPATALKRYAPIDPNFSRFQFPGQLVITCTTYLPSLFFYMLCVLVVCLKPIYFLSQKILEVLYLGRRKDRCSQTQYITLLIGVATFGLKPAQELLTMIAGKY